MFKVGMTTLFVLLILHMCMSIGFVIQSHYQISSLETIVRENQNQLKSSRFLVDSIAVELNDRTPIIRGLTEDLATANKKIDQIQEYLKIQNSATTQRVKVIPVEPKNVER